MKVKGTVSIFGNFFFKFGCDSHSVLKKKRWQSYILCIIRKKNVKNEKNYVEEF